jgi:hypothetical protein
VTESITFLAKFQGVLVICSVILWINLYAEFRPSCSSSYCIYTLTLCFCVTFICVSRCSKKTMVGLRDTKSYTGLGRSPTSSLRDDSSSCSSVECSKVRVHCRPRSLGSRGGMPGCDQRRRRVLSPYVGKLWDAAAGGRSESMSAIGHGVQVSRMKNLARAEGEYRCWPVDVGELGVPQADAATSSSSVGESVTGVMSHRFLFINESARLSPYLAHQLSMFCRPTSEFIRVSRCFRKMMAALKGMRSYTGSG